MLRVECLQLRSILTCFFDAMLVSKNGVIVFRKIYKIYRDLHSILGAGGLMETSDQVRMACASVAAKIATLRNCGLPMSSNKFIPTPVLDLISLMRIRLGVVRWLIYISPAK